MDETKTHGDEIDTNRFGELHLSPDRVRGLQKAWHQFCSSAPTRTAAAEAIYTAIFEGAPSLQVVFTQSRAELAMRFMDGIHRICNCTDDPRQLKNVVETLAFVHLSLDVTVSRVVLFRDALLDLFVVELDDAFTPTAHDAWRALLNYIGSGIIFVKASCQDRLTLLASSWKEASNRKIDHKSKAESKAESKESKAGESKADDQADEEEEDTKNAKKTTQFVPTTFNEMFQFNAAVMGFGQSAWLKEVLSSLDILVTNVTHSARLQEECDTLVLRISKVTTGPVNISEFKSVMLASLRQMLPGVWGSNYEVAWQWLWDNVEAILKRTMGTISKWQGAIQTLIGSLDEAQRNEFQRAIYIRFFDMAPAGQDHFKQSNTRLYFIAERVMAMVTEIFDDPVLMADDISALGLRHVGYGIPTELIPFFVSACVDTVGDMTKDQAALEGFTWSLGLISRTLIRTIQEGSTIVMKAVDVDTKRAVRRALTSAPRGERSSWMLIVQVGTQSLSPFMFSVESGSLAAAEAIIEDLLTIRADREKYYYGIDALFDRHPDLIRRLAQDGPTLLPVLFDGMMWRSRVARQGQRRVNYYVKHLIVAADGTFSDALSAMISISDPRIMVHPVMLVLSDTLWNHIVRRRFIKSKIWFMLSLVVFMMSQSVLPNMLAADDSDTRYSLLIFLGRIMNYVHTMVRLICVHGLRWVREYRAKKVIYIFKVVPIPAYLHHAYDKASFVLMVFMMLMCSHEPIFWCLTSDEDWPAYTCEESWEVEDKYAIFSMLAMAIHWGLLVDVAVFSNEFSAFVLICGNVMSEIGRFLVSIFFLLITFGSAISVLDHGHLMMQDIPSSVLFLAAHTIRLYDQTDYRHISYNVPLVSSVFVYIMLSVVLLLNLLIAQINCSYQYINREMAGWARLSRATVICETIYKCPREHWDRGVAALGFDNPIEFNEGDVGLPGGINTEELASLNPVLEDRIRRFGGSCSPETPWPQETTIYGDEDGEEDKLDRMERLIAKAVKRLTRGGTGSREGGSRDEGSGSECGAHRRGEDSGSDDGARRRGVTPNDMMADGSIVLGGEESGIIGGEDSRSYVGGEESGSYDEEDGGNSY